MRKSALLITALLVFSAVPSWAANDASHQVSTLVVSGIERSILKYTNDHREQMGLPPLSESSGLDQLSRSFSVEMVQTGYFSHNMQDGTSFEQRIARSEVCGNDCPESAENIYEINYQSLENLIDQTRSDDQVDAIAKDIVDGWIASPTHRRNIEDPLLEEIGIGVGLSDKGEIYATQDFIRRTALNDEQYKSLQGVPHDETPANNDPGQDGLQQ